MLRRLMLPRSGWRKASSIPPLAKRNISFKNAFKQVIHPGPPVLARFPLLQQTFWFLKYVTAFLLGLHIFVDYFYAIHSTWGVSMVPTLAPDGDGVVISKYYRHGRGIKVGDIVSFIHPLDREMRSSKRVIGMPGDFVIRDTPHKGNGLMVQVPEGHCWVVGDNLTHSRDSRMFGPLPLALVRGKVVSIVTRWLPPRFEAVPDPFKDGDESDYVID